MEKHVSEGSDTKSSLAFNTARRWYSHILPPLVLVVGLLATLEIWHMAMQNQERELRDYFDFRVRQALTLTEQRMLVQEQVLRGALGLFTTFRDVKREEFRNYVANLRLEADYPGIQGVGFSLIVPPSQKEKHIAAVRREGFPQYTIRPVGVRGFYTAIVYLEPLTGRNLRAFGYDMFSESVRRKAMEAARDTGATAISGKVTLVQETEKDVQAGFLIYLPFYRNGMPHSTIEERRANIVGWVYSPLRMNDLARGMYGERADDLDIEIYDGDEIAPDALLYNSIAGSKESATTSLFSVQRFKFANHVWTLRIRAMPSLGSRITTASTSYLIYEGIAISLLLAWLTWLLIRGRERELSEAHSEAKRLRDALDHVGAYVYMKDRQHRYVYANEITLKLFNCSAEELKNSPDSRFFPPETVAHLKEIDDRVLEHGENTQEEIVSTGPDGGSLIFLEIKTPIYDGSGNIIGLCGISHDITQRKSIEDELNKYREHLEELVRERTAALEGVNKELEAFSYSISHDLRAPLRAIDGFSRILLDDYGDKLDDEGKRLITVVQSNALRMGQLIEDILKFSRMGRTEMVFGVVDMEALAREVCDELRSTAGPGRELKVDIARLPPARGDRALLRQVFVNLISNAIKFTCKKPVSAITVGATVEAGETLYFVRDNGAGFDMQFADRLFGVFQRLHTTSEFEGTGIGLAIVNRIVSRHGGRVWAEGVVNEGATFYFALPALTHA